ncbi:hypothetical protein G7Y29_03695 [Corynebacterium qintianiae]|uniref:LGFP repeat-containing protein n=1 Tax=Corynebacterium qintianiae TaxID=2709392 RepID=A0A7T0PGC4_9CORY|nr:hypothetical protein [Corynebacterium qintianiae]QPK83907.1 hypothetical protein G7Y29_03695 [Corynebacterium qintianiae]
MNITRTITATVAAAALTTGLVACSAQEDKAAETAETTVAETATETNTATETATPSESKGATEAEAGTVAVDTADGAQAMVPAGLAEAMDTYAQAEWGEPLSVEETEEGWITAYDGGHYVTWNENTGGAPTWGEIANNWLTTVEPEQGLGFPVAAETPLEDGSGWVQEFENGTIEWARGEDGLFQANVNVTN